MQLTLDHSTLVVIVGFISAIVLPLMIEVRRINKEIAGPSWWLGACMSYLLAFLFGPPTFDALNYPPDYGIVINNTFGVLGSFLMLQGTLKFRGFRLLPNAWIVFMLVFAIIIIFLKDDQIYRYAVLDPTLIFLKISCAWAMLYKVKPHERVVHGLAAGFQLIHAVASAVRLSTLFSWLEIPELTASISQKVVLLATAGNLMGWSYAVGLACNLRAQYELHRQATEDALTGLCNRRYFRGAVNQEIMRSQRTGARLAVCMIDLNGFKGVNDTLGHEAGDLLLIEVSRRLRRNARKTDIIARLGGDEFAILIHDVLNEDTSGRVMSRLRDSINGEFYCGGACAVISISAGIAIWPEDGVSYEDLLKVADVRMYEDKRSLTRRII